MRLVLLLAVAALSQSPDPRPGESLRDGQQLVYRANGADQPPWHVDSVRPEPAPPAAGECVRVFLRRNPDQTRADDTRLCRVRDTLVAWVAARNAWVPQRPVGPRMTLVLPRPNGDTVTYTTGERSTETISGRTIVVIATTVLTVDSLGRPKRRLRERYAQGLVTAAGGVFEEPDGPGGWKEIQRFDLVAIREP